jgi:glycosyltransferase involved in cell wall biosynthesis
MKISLIIPTKNKLSRLKAVLLSLKYQTNPEFETIVVNDGGDDISSIFSEIDYPHRYTVINQSNRGRAASRNSGACSAHSENLIFLDDDCMVRPDFIPNKIIQTQNMDVNCMLHGVIYNLTYLKFFEDPFSGVLYDEFKTNNPDVLKSQTFTYDDIKDFPYLLKTTKSKFTKLEKSIHTIFNKNLRKLYWLCCVGGNITIKKELFESVNGFDEAFGKEWGCEDLEFGYRLRKQNVSFYFDKENPVFHLDHYRQGSDELLKKAFDYFFQKHRDANIEKVFNHFFLKNKGIEEVYELLD